MRVPQVNPYHLVVFYCVAKEQSMSAAAKDLFITQPAVSNHIISLEKATRLKLIRVIKQRVILTPAGEGLYQYAKEVYEQLITAGRFIEITRGSSLNIGISPLFNTVISPLVEKIFNQLSPDISLNFETKESHFLIEDILDSTIDLAFISFFKQRDSRLSYVPIANDVKLMFYASSTNPIFNKDKVEWKDLADYQLITGSQNSFITEFVLNKLKQEGLKAEIRGPHIINNQELTKRLVMNGNFVGVAFGKSIEEQLNSGKLRTISLPDDVLINVSLVFYQNILLPEMIKSLISLAREAFASFADRPLVSTTI